MKLLLIIIAGLLITHTGIMAQNTRLVIDPQAHSGIVNGMEFTNNGKYLISVSDDKTIRIWDVDRGVLDRTLRTFAGDGPNGSIYAMALSPDSRYLAIGGYFEENEIRLLDLEKQTAVVVLKGHKNVVTSIDFSNDGLQLASSDASGIILVWDINFSGGKITGKLSKTLAEHTAQVYDISFSPNTKQLVSASYDGTLNLWDLTNQVKPISMKMHIDKVQSCVFSADGKWIISGGNKGKVILWNNRGAFSKYLASINEPVRDISLMGDDVLIAGSKGYRYSVGATVVKSQLTLPFANASASAISTQKFAALAGGAQGAIILYNLADDEPVQIFRNRSNQIKKIGISINGNLVFKPKNAKTLNGFNVASFTYSWDASDFGDFEVEKHKEGSYALQEIDAHTLSTGFKGKVQMNPRLDGRIRSYTIVNDETIAVGGDFSLKLYSNEGMFKGDLKGFNGAVISLAATNNRIIALGEDQTIRIWNVETQELLASLYVAPKGDWICWTPQGYYDASSGGEKYMGWQVDRASNTYSLFFKSSVFSSKFRKSEIVKQTIRLGNFSIGKEKVKDVNKIAKRSIDIPAAKEKDEKQLETADEKLSDAAPTIEWLTPELQNSELDQPKITIKAIIKSKTKVKMVKILINGRPSSNSRGVVIPKSVGDNDLLVEQEIILTHDINEVRIFVANEEAKMVSEKRVVNLTGVDTRGAGRSLEVIDYSGRPDLYILSIGISDYQNSAYDLNYADNDAESIDRVFKNIGTEVYKDVNVVRLLNSEADKASILEAFDNLEHQVKPKDMVLIFIASHGINEDGGFFILPYDADLIQKPDNVVSWKDITQTLSGLPSNVIIMIDACRSGQLGVNLTEYGADNTEALRNASNDENGLVLMAASTGKESALETPAWEHGAFTLAILEGIEKGMADVKPDGTIYLRELDFYVSERTIELTENAQHPTTQKPSTISRLSIINLNK